VFALRGLAGGHVDQAARGGREFLLKEDRQTMDSAAAGLIGMGCAAAGFAGAGVGIGYIFGKMIEVVARQPEAEARVTKYMWIGFALVEAIALYGLVIAFIIMGFRKG
jgi:F-type H+-transporting ATPase subunit c